MPTQVLNVVKYVTMDQDLHHHLQKHKTKGSPLILSGFDCKTMVLTRICTLLIIEHTSNMAISIFKIVVLFLLVRKVLYSNVGYTSMYDAMAPANVWFVDLWNI